MIGLRKSFWMPLAVLLGALSCARRASQPPPQQGGWAPQQQGWYGQPTPPQQPGYPPQYPYPAPGAPTSQPHPAPFPVPTAAPPAQPAPTPAPPATSGVPLPGAFNPINAGDVGWLRWKASNILVELIDGLPAGQAAMVRPIPFAIDPTPGEVNAFAGCDDSGQSFLAITDGLLAAAANLARLRATEEVFRNNKLTVYQQHVASSGSLSIPSGLLTSTEDNHPSKLVRQEQVFEEVVAFVLAHELAHHYLGHTGCVGAATRTAIDFGRVLSRMLPMFNQTNEIGSDGSGVQNVMSAGARRAGYHWTEAGGVLVMSFFGALEGLTPGRILFPFQATHPYPLMRIPLIQGAANAWRFGLGGFGR